MIDESNNYQLGLDFFYRQNSDNFSYFRKHFLKQMTDESNSDRFFISFSLERSSWKGGLTAPDG